MNFKKCLIISGGDYAPYPEDPTDCYIIACDRGYAYSLQMGLKPDLVLGDFDSYTGDINSDYTVLRLKPEKDDTDTLHAVRIALEKGFEKIDICCTLGGQRFDHAYANLQTAVLAAKKGAEVTLYGQDTFICTLQNSQLTLPRKENAYLSVFSVTDQSKGVTISGTKYLLKDAQLTNDFPLGVSNEWVEASAEIRVEDGLLLIMVCPK